LEEAEEMPSFDQWDKIRKSIRALDVRNLNILILNPAVKTHWIYEEFFEDRGVQEGFNGIVKNVLYIHTTYLDISRQFIPDSIFLDFEEKRIAYETYESTPKDKREFLDKKIIKNALYYKHVVNGGWLNNAEGVIFENWSIGDFDDSLPYVWGCDFGFSVDPTTLTKCAVDKKRKRIYVKEAVYRSGMSTDTIYSEFLKYANITGQITADSAEPRLISELKLKGLNIKPCIKGAGSITAGISAMQDYEIIVHPDSLNIVKELNNYVWHDKKAGVPVDAYQHSIDGIRYAVHPIIKTKRERSIMGS
jgi:phage terminase large subunit